MAKSNDIPLGAAELAAAKARRRIVLEALVIAILVHVLLVVLFRYTPPHDTAPLTPHHSIRLAERFDEEVLDRMDPYKGAVPEAEWSFQAIELFPQIREAPALTLHGGNYPSPAMIRLPRFVRFSNAEESATRYGVWQYNLPVEAAVAQEYPMAITPDGGQIALKLDLPGMAEVKRSTRIVLTNGDPVRSSIVQSSGNHTLDFAALKWALRQTLQSDSAEYRIIWNQEVEE